MWLLKILSLSSNQKGQQSSLMQREFFNLLQILLGVTLLYQQLHWELGLLVSLLLLQLFVNVGKRKRKLRREKREQLEKEKQKRERAQRKKQGEVEELLGLLEKAKTDRLDESDIRRRDNLMSSLAQEKLNSLKNQVLNVHTDAKEVDIK